jgi:polysaccharide biosynthesis transport protein
MNNQPIPVSNPGLSLGDLYFILFRHKWKILACCALGAAAAAAVYRSDPPPYQSEAKLFVRYIVTEGKNLGPAAPDSAKSPDQRGETIMRSETEILGSFDLARQVAEAIGAERLLARAGGGNDPVEALTLVKRNLSVNVAPGSTVINVTFRHPDPALVQPVLREVIERYLRLHVETHTASGMLGDFLTQETDQLRARLARTEEELRRASQRAGVVSIEEAKQAYGAQIAALRRELFSAQAELAQREAVLEELNKRQPGIAAAALSDIPVPAEVMAEYRSVLNQIDLLQRMEHELLTQFTPENVRVMEVRAQLSAAESRRGLFHERYPRLHQIGATAERAVSGNELDAIVVATEMTALTAKARVLLAQLAELRAEAARMDEMEGLIVELRRKKELEEANYRHYAASLEQSRINETLGNGRVSNISQIQTPSPPFSQRGKSHQVIGMILAGGLLAGIGWAFMIEMYLDRSIKRPVDVERMIDAPLFLAIPRLSRRDVRLLKAPVPLLNAAKGDDGPSGASGVNGANGSHSAGSNGSRALAPTDAGNPLQVFHETLRDRLIGYFESINLTHKPKLVAVTGLNADAGVSTTAAGLARSLSETGEGNVLLVDMNFGQGAAQQFVKGRAVCGLDEILDGRDGAHVDENLYVVVENSSSDRLSRNLPTRFTKLVPKLKASDFDYIIFDMPPVSQISITPRLAGFMDMVLMVVESEKTDRNLVQRANALLSESRAHIGVVLNKTRNYVPSRLYQENLTIS